MAWLIVPRRWRDVIGTARLRVPGATLGEVVDQLRRRYPPLTGWLDNGLGSLPGYVHLFIDETDANVLGGRRAPVDDDTEIHVVIEMSGG